jgi:hypothetical protein
LCLAQVPEDPLPSVEALRTGIAERAQRDAQIEREIETRYRFTHTRTREEFSLRGKLKRKEFEERAHDPTAPKPGAEPSTAKEGRRSAAGRAHGPPKEPSDEEFPDRSYERKDVNVTEELLRRFQFTILGRELREGLPLLKIQFRPVAPDPPAKGLLERFLNRMAGTIWVDETDFTVACGSFRLTEKVQVGGGILGSVSAFECWFERGRTEEGLWYTRRVDWRLECREFLINKIIEQREAWDELRKVKAP